MLKVLLYLYIPIYLSISIYTAVVCIQYNVVDVLPQRSVLVVVTLRGPNVGSGLGTL